MSSFETSSDLFAELADEIVAKLDPTPRSAATVGYPGAQTLSPTIRRTEIAAFKREDGVGHIFDFINEGIGRANKAMWLADVGEVVSLHYLVYRAEDAGHYDWHQDEKLEDNRAHQRKLSFIMLLSDPVEFSGGAFQFKYDNGSIAEHLRQKGATIIFPSYKMHRVTPVVRGIRRSLVAWAEGPRWR